LTFYPAMGKSSTELYLANLGNHLKKLREAKGLSLRELAAECSIDHSDIAKMEKGERNITFLTMVELSKALQLPLKKILDFDLDDK
jgi:transcriptional regulator with XRE-family HTH domain